MRRRKRRGVKPLFIFKQEAIMLKKPFNYWGSKGRFYKEIRQIFQENKRAAFVDLFAGGMEVPVNIKKDFPDVEVVANVKDANLEAFINQRHDAADIYEQIIAVIYGGEEIETSRQVYDTNKSKWERLKQNYYSIFKERCEHCGAIHKKDKAESAFDSKLCKILLSMNTENLSLKNSFYSPGRTEAIRKYVAGMDRLKIETEFFDSKRRFKDSFIFLDPPYIQNTKTDEEKNFIGFQYATRTGVNWSREDDVELISFVIANLNDNNVFLLFGSMGNGLEELIKSEVPQERCTWIEKRYKANVMGKMNSRAEWFCLVK